MEDTTKYGLLALVVLSILGIGVYVFRKKIFESKTLNILEGFPSEEVEVLTMKEVVTYLKDQNLDSQKHVPFLASRISKFKKSLPQRDGLTTMIAGVYNESSDIFLGKIYYAGKLSEDIKALIGNEELIVLS